MNINSILLSIGVFFIIVLLLIKFRNWLISSDKQMLLKHSMIPLSEMKPWIVKSILIISTYILMYFMVPYFFSEESEEWIPIGVVLMSSIFIIPMLHLVLDDMREDKLSIKNFFSQDFLLLAYLIIFTEFTILNWLKEVNSYFIGAFFLFVVLYSIIIMIIGIYLTFPKKFVLNWRLTSINILDPIILICLIGVFTQITLTIILLI